MRPNHASELFRSFLAQKPSATIDPSRPQPQLCQYCQCQRDPHVRHHLQIRHLQIPKATKFAFSQNKLQKQINQAGNQLISCLINLFSQLILRKCKFGSFLVAVNDAVADKEKKKRRRDHPATKQDRPAAYFIRTHPTADPEDPCDPDPASGCRSCW